jgi:cell division protein FtsI/penicillin-binding protein 2/cell division protein FtsW (lipid II flippase)
VVAGTGVAGRQCVLAVLGFALGAWLRRCRVRLLMGIGWACYGVAVMFLVVVTVAGTAVNGATRWISVGPVTFQPSELVKLGLLWVLALTLGSSRPVWQRFGLAVLLALVPITLTLLQPDLSTCALLVALSVAMLVLGRAPARVLMSLLAVAALLAPLMVGVVRPYQLRRLGTFLAGSGQRDSGSGWAVGQARIAVGSSGWVGPGQPWTGLLGQYLPERHTDLAVASVVEQFGMLAGALVVAVAVLLTWRLALATRAPRGAPGALIAGGLAVLIGTESVVSLGGNLGLLPLAGVPFPLLSYGGTALVVHLAALGVALGVRRDGARRRLWAAGGWRLQRPRLVRAAAFGLTVLLVGFAGAGWQLRDRQGPVLAAQGAREMSRCVRLPAVRGQILDRHGATLAAGSADGAASVLVVPALLRAAPAGISRLATALGQPVAGVRAALDASAPNALAVEVAQVQGPVAAAVTRAAIDGAIDGVIVTVAARRMYPAGPVLGPVLGFTGVATAAEQARWPDLPLGEVVGRAGIEQQYDAVLRGLDGQQCVYVNPRGMPVAMGARTEPVAGANLRLSLDLGLQRVLTDHLGDAVRAQPGGIGGAVALDPTTGQVLALASVPGYDNNIYGPPVDGAALARLSHAAGSPMREHASQSAVPPGSTFKLVVATANQLHGVLDPDRPVPTGATYTLGDHTFHNWRPMGSMDLSEALAWSNDVYFYQLAAALGPDAMITTARALGVGQPTGLDLPSESVGYLGSPSSVRAAGGAWYPGSTIILGIGQGYLTATPLQAARWTTAVTTGQLVSPRLGVATGDAPAWVALPVPKPQHLPFAASLAPIREGMRAAVTGGTAAALADLSAPVEAKTGTAQDGSLPGDSYDNWVTAAAPIAAPTIVITVLTQGTGVGANSATAVAHQGLAYYLAHQPDIHAMAPTQGP